MLQSSPLAFFFVFVAILRVDSNLCTTAPGSRQLPALSLTSACLVKRRMGIKGVDLFLYCETDIDVIIDQARIFLLPLHVAPFTWQLRSACYFPISQVNVAVLATASAIALLILLLIQALVHMPACLHTFVIDLRIGSPEKLPLTPDIWLAAACVV